MLLDLLVRLPPLPCSLEITDRSFQYASPHLWNKLPFSLHKPVSPLYAYLNPSFSSPLSSSSPIHSFTPNSKLASLVNSFRHRSLIIDTRDWLPRLMRPTLIGFTLRAYAKVVLGVVILSVRLSVCPSVRLSHACIVTKLNDALQIFLYHAKGQSLCYSDTKSGRSACGDAPFPLKSAFKVTHPLRKTPTLTDFRS